MDLEGCLVITHVAENSPAWQEGLRPKMFISHVAGDRVRTRDDFYAAVARLAGPVQLRLTLPVDQRPMRTIGPGT